MKKLNLTTPTVAQVIEAANCPTNDISSALWIVTPEVAKYVLDNMNPGNRIRSDVEMAAIGDDMSRDLWLLNGDSLKFGGGELLDGQHRLKACTQTDKPFTSVVVSGIHPDCFTTIDSGRSKTSADIFKKAGIKYFSPTARATQNIFRWTAPASRKGHPLTSYSKDRSHVLLSWYLNNCPDMWEFAGDKDVIAVSKTHSHPIATLVALRAFFGAADEKKARAFFKEWSEVPVNSPPDASDRKVVRVMQRVLHDRLVNLTKIGGNMDDRDRITIAIKAWRKFAYKENTTYDDMAGLVVRPGKGSDIKPAPWLGAHKDPAIRSLNATGW